MSNLSSPLFRWSAPIALCVFASAAHAAPDYTPVRQACAKLGASIDNIATHIGAVNDVNTLLDLMDSFSDGSEGLATAVADLRRKNPDLDLSKDPQIKEILDSMKPVQHRADALGMKQVLGERIREFARDPRVQAAAERMMLSSQHLHSVDPNSATPAK
jgi:hypothetical protein